VQLFLGALVCLIALLNHYVEKLQKAF